MCYCCLRARQRSTNTTCVVMGCFNIYIYREGETILNTTNINGSMSCAASSGAWGTRYEENFAVGVLLFLCFWIIFLVCCSFFSLGVLVSFTAFVAIDVSPFYYYFRRLFLCILRNGTTSDSYYVVHAEPSVQKMIAFFPSVPSSLFYDIHVPRYASPRSEG